MKLPTAAVALVLLVSLVSPATADMAFSATLNGTNNVPSIPVITATGTATFTLNTAQTQLTYHISFSGLSSAESGAHIHNAGPRANGPIAFVLPLGNPKDGVWDITPLMVTELLAGRLYVNIHSDLYVSGEIRGNITATVPVEDTSWGAVKAKYRTR